VHRAPPATRVSNPLSGRARGQDARVAPSALVDDDPTVSDVAAVHTADLVRAHDVSSGFAAILERYGVEEVRPESGQRFDHKEHRVAATSPTGDAARHGTIADTRVPGYRLGGRVLRYPEVVVHRHVVEA
jgi:hypothetical protein